MSSVRTLTLESLGRTYPLNVPEHHVFAVEKPVVRPLSDPASGIGEALTHPIGSAPLFEAAGGASNATVVVDDWGRSDTTRRQVAPIVLDHLNRAGIPDDKITVLIARGIGRAPSMEKIAETFGPALLARPVRRQLSAMHRSGQKFLGFSRNGSPVWVDRLVTDADFVVGIGSVYPSPWGGWTGGAKIIVPGVAASDTIRHNHSMMMRIPPGMWDSPALIDREEMAQMAGLDFLVNLVLTPEGKIASVRAGEFRQAHRCAGQDYRDWYTVHVPLKPNVVVTTVDWWQGPQSPMTSLFGFLNLSLASLERIADPGATIVLIGNLPGGVPAAMREYMRSCYTLEDLADLWEKSGTLAFIAVMMSIQLKIRQQKYRMILALDSVGRDLLEDLGFETAGSPDDALQMACSQYGEATQIAVLPALGCPTWPVID